MTPEEKFSLIEDWLGRPMTKSEQETARNMLETAPSQFGGSYSSVYIARYLDMQRKAGRNTA